MFIINKFIINKHFKIYLITNTYYILVHLNYHRNHFYGYISMFDQYIVDHLHNEIDPIGMEYPDILPHHDDFYSLNIHHIFFPLAHMDRQLDQLLKFLLMVSHSEYHQIDIYDRLHVR